jgi:carboxylate-amine ligase
MSVEFLASSFASIGVELELQIIDLSDLDLSSGASFLLQHLQSPPKKITVTPELTESMIEIAIGVFDDWIECFQTSCEVQKLFISASDRLNIGISGGGAHPFQRWQQRRISDNVRFQRVSSLYGYLAKQFTVFGQHVHIGCTSGDQALRLLHGLNRYVPHFIALSASSPFLQGSFTSFHSSRLNSIAAFPLSGRAPFFTDWNRFNSEFYKPMLGTGIVESMKDFYWDIRPKPQYGTIELRVCDTPLTLFDATLIAGYLQLICRHLEKEQTMPLEQEYMVYSFNRFQACRFGLEGTYIDPVTRSPTTIRQSLRDTLDRLETSIVKGWSDETLVQLIHEKVQKGTDAAILMDKHSHTGTMEDIVLYAMQLFRQPFSHRVLGHCTP